MAVAHISFALTALDPQNLWRTTLVTADVGLLVVPALVLPKRPWNRVVGLDVVDSPETTATVVGSPPSPIATVGVGAVAVAAH